MAPQLESPPVQAFRRTLLAMPGGLVALAGGFGALAPVPAAEAQTTHSPESALQALLDGNRRYVSGKLSACNQDLQQAKRETAHKQEPFAAVLSCADSRVPVEMVFDQGIGHVFVTRVAGNIATPEIIASLEYGVAVLGARLIMVLGHGNCGAVKATIAGKAVPGQISSLYQFIRPAVDQAGHDPDQAIRANAQIQARLLAQSSPVLAKAISDQALRVVAAYYDIAMGRVTVLPG